MSTTLVPYPPMSEELRRWYEHPGVSKGIEGTVQVSRVRELYGRGEEEHFSTVLEQVGAQLRGERNRFGWGRASQSAENGEKTAQ